MPTAFIPREVAAGERRVAATPETAKKLAKLGLEIVVEAGAGVAAGFLDAAYVEAGARVESDAERGFSTADLVLAVAPLSDERAESLKRGAILVALLDPFRNRRLVEKLAARSVSSFSMELVPRVTRAQEMDVLSSQASIAGYKAVVLAATRLGKYFPLLMTAAGTIQPARVVVLGAGVAGLQAIATAKRLGAVVEVSDVRPAVKEQVESLGAKFIELPQVESGEGKGGYAKELSQEALAKQREILKQRIAAADVVITTAQVPGKRAPILVARDVVEGMRPGSVIVDLAAAQGGNCELTRVDEEVVHGGVVILGPANLAATMAHDASLLFARNVAALVGLLVKEKTLAVREDDDVVKGTLLTHGGKVVHAGIAAAYSGGTSA